MSERPSQAAARTPIAIIGAGPGGLSLARILTDRGLPNITLVERAPRVGGKNLTVHHRGIGHELGACYTTWGYTHVKDWMEEAGITSHRLPEHIIHMPDGSTQDFKDFVLGDNRIKAYAQIAEYNQRWIGFFKDQQMATDQEEWSADVGRPFGQWLDDHGLDVVKRFAWRTMTAMGYGHVDAVPALYGLRWNTPSLLLSAAALRVDEPVPGWQHLWQHLAWRLDVRLATRVDRVVRRDDKVVVETNKGDIHAKHLVVSSPLDEAADWLPLTDAETAAFSHIHWSEYVTTLVEVEGWFRDEDTHSFARNLFGADGDRRGHLLVVRRTGDKTPVAAIRSAKRRSLYVCYQYGGADLPNDELERRLRADIEGQGGTIARIHTRCRWKYAPQLDMGAIRQGYAFKLEELQGQDRVWYTGASMSHEAIDNIVDYNTWLADRIEHRVRTEAGEDLGERWLTRRRRKHLRSIHNK